MSAGGSSSSSPRPPPPRPVGYAAYAVGASTGSASPSSSSAPAAAAPPFTAEMRDRQARGKDPYNLNASADDVRIRPGYDGMYVSMMISAFAVSPTSFISSRFCCMTSSL